MCYCCHSGCCCSAPESSVRHIIPIHAVLEPNFRDICKTVNSTEPRGPDLLDLDVHAHVFVICCIKKVQVGNDQEKAQSEKDSHSKNSGGKKIN